MIKWKALQSDELYRIDLIQEPLGRRYIRLRRADDEPNPDTALSTRPYLGSTLSAFRAEPSLSENILIEDGRSFVLDAHDVWMTQEEFEFWRSHRFKEVTSVDAPWVNGIAPSFPPS